MATTTDAVEVETTPPDNVATQVVIYSVTTPETVTVRSPLVVVYSDPAELVVTITTPVSVVG